ncbi:MAG: hypothetical protein OEV37_02545 [Candidatus Berkelbacteria bacterium]|nr:hypothetical protein [Candidatus Berkelbacteria bacterium]
MQPQTEPQSRVRETSWEWPGWLTALIVAAIVAIIAAVLFYLGAPNWLSFGIAGAIAVGIAAGVIFAALDERPEQWVIWPEVILAIVAIFGYGIGISVPFRWWDGLVGGVIAFIAGLITYFVRSGDDDYDTY